MLRPEFYFDLSKTRHAALFDGVERVWEVLHRIPEYAASHSQRDIQGTVSEQASVEGDVVIGPGTVVEATAVIRGPAIIGANCQIRAGAYVRDNAIVGDSVVVGHATEIKHCLLFDGVDVPHFAYVGDSVMGWKSHLGAGVKVSNLKINWQNVSVTIEGQRYDTGLQKFGAIIGDEVEIGCNAVLNPGTMIGKRTLAYAMTSLTGYYPPDKIIKLRQQHDIADRLQS